ncbi:putative DNA modification/repair radical SAM protein [Acetobacter sp.]|jgi:putative DNA modification/repair radical SAM protein|uniref:putative DNA modification/repair radical SAM protein n=1 Tax=Acetobacter sp. TaxID=440 RepID=UPI0025B7F683|nr:putative DNA modification/repair radical SAM protein [Acetobacter sp.]MCH4090970.1 putative DNA modification/repair radical SAM protein [Acetobacter sp.]MCI1300811.1 putative DNA modification/repair radical SAM protein [Acetobacter sp.]MCI1317084.1 putative DNA modification/repair radical SAM protein [Acetobacter sp.]
MKRTFSERLAILSDAAKYDASCASSGSDRRGSTRQPGLGSTERSGICHSWTPDGRCVSLLKILMTNFCVYDCAYCINRASSGVERARFSVEEIVWLTMEFCRRNYIEGLFLSSGIIRSSDYTMEELVRVARVLRLDRSFRGYIHLKAIPDASPDLLAEAGLYTDRLSINVEMPTETGLNQYAPEKDAAGIRSAMEHIRKKMDATKEKTLTGRRPPRFAPGGQSTQMIVGADAATDQDILSSSSSLYSDYRLKRVYYSAFSPIPHASQALPARRPPLLREHRLYQADWLFRFYGFQFQEITESRPDGMLDLEVDPKLSWALDNRAIFPVDINQASRELLLRVPGLGPRSVKVLLTTRRHKTIRLDDLERLRVSLRKIRPFITTPDWRPVKLIDRLDLKSLFAPPPQQLSLL